MIVFVKKNISQEHQSSRVGDDIGHIWHRGGTFWKDNRKQLLRKGWGELAFSKGWGKTKQNFKGVGNFFSKVGQTHFSRGKRKCWSRGYPGDDVIGNFKMIQSS